MMSQGGRRDDVTEGGEDDVTGDDVTRWRGDITKKEEKNDVTVSDIAVQGDEVVLEIM